MLHPLRLAFLLSLSVILAVNSTVSADGFADFDDLDEGFLSYAAMSGGICFWDSRTFYIDEEPAIFVIENATNGIGDDILDHFSPPNVFQTSGYITNGGYLITRWAEVRMTTGQVESYARMDVFYKDDDEFQGTEMVLEALLDGVRVFETSQVINDPRREVRATSFEVTGVVFDELRLFGRGNPIPPLSGFLGSLDNVEISGGGPGSDLRLDMPSPGTPGEQTSLTATWTTPGDVVYFAASLNRGSTPVPVCPGVTSVLQNPTLLGSSVVDQNGNATIDFFVPPAARTRNAYFQAIEPGSCTLSNFVPFTFAP